MPTGIAVVSSRLLHERPGFPSLNGQQEGLARKAAAAMLWTMHNQEPAMGATS
jgi:hypothetical protein